MTSKLSDSKTIWFVVDSFYVRCQAYNRTQRIVLKYISHPPTKQKTPHGYGLPELSSGLGLRYIHRFNSPTHCSSRATGQQTTVETFGLGHQLSPSAASNIPLTWSHTYTTTCYQTHRFFYRTLQMRLITCTLRQIPPVCKPNFYKS